MSREAKDAVRACTWLSGSARHLAMTMADYANTKTGRIWPSVSTLAHDAGRTVSWVWKWRAALLEAGAIKCVVRSKGGSPKNTSVFKMDFAVLAGGPPCSGDDAKPLLAVTNPSTRWSQPLHAVESTPPRRGEDHIGSSLEAPKLEREDPKLEREDPTTEQTGLASPAAAVVSDAGGDAGSGKLEKVLASLDPGNPRDQRMAALIYGRTPELKQNGERG